MHFEYYVRKGAHFILASLMIVPPIKAFQDLFGCNGKSTLRIFVFLEDHSGDLQISDQFGVVVIRNQCGIDCGPFQ